MVLADEVVGQKARYCAWSGVGMMGFLKLVIYGLTRLEWTVLFCLLRWCSRCTLKGPTNFEIRCGPLHFCANFLVFVEEEVFVQVEKGVGFFIAILGGLGSGSLIDLSSSLSG